MLEVPGGGLGEGRFFEVFTFADEIANALPVGDACDFLLDDRALIEIGGSVMGSSSNQFNAALIGLVVGLAASEGGEERVLNVDDGAAAVADHVC